MPSGNYTYTVTVVFNSWTTSATSSEVTVANVAPSASAPGVGATARYGTNEYWVNHENVTLTDSPNTNGGSAIPKVTYCFCLTSQSSCTNASTANWTQIAASTTAGTWTYTWTNTSLAADGTYYLMATATNADPLTSTPSSSTPRLAWTPRTRPCRHPV